MNQIVLHPELEKRVERARIESEWFSTPRDFLHHLFMMGLLEFEFRVLPELTGKPYVPYPLLEKKNEVSS